jgi:hypothetical protein
MTTPEVRERKRAAGMKPLPRIKPKIEKKSEIFTSALALVSGLTNNGF